MIVSNLRKLIDCEETESIGRDGFKWSPLCTILRYPFLMTYPKNFLKVPLAPIYTKFFWSTFFLKVHKNAFFMTCFFKDLPAAQKFGPKLSLFIALRELGKSIWST